MQIDPGRYLDPDRNAITMIPAIALSMMVFAYSVIFGPISVLMFYGFWLPAFLLRPQLLLRQSGLVIVLLLIPFVATLSMFWSQAPSTTMRAGIQYGTTVFCGLIAARLVSVSNLMVGGLLGGLLVLLYSWFNGSSAYDVVDGTYTFVGAFGSKNQLGYFASLTILFAIGVGIIFRAVWGLRLLAALIGLFAAQVLLMSDSATSVLTLLFAIGIVFIARGLFALPEALRRLTILVLMALGLAIALSAVQLGAFDAILSAFNKDPTLTGRTYLWNRGITIGGENPFLGLGYNAFWIHDHPPAEELWREFYITGRTGFHFHNTLIEAYVGLGMLGVAIMGLLTLSLLVFPIRVMMNRHATGGAIMCAGLSLLFLVRSTVEIDYFTPYTAGSFLVPFLLLKMSDSRRLEKTLKRKPAQPNQPRIVAV